jgi:general secretion pathway protein A
MRAAAGEVFDRRFTPHWVPWAATAAVGAALIAATAALWMLGPWGSDSAPSAGAAAPGPLAAVPAAALTAVPGAAAAPAAPPALAQLLSAHATETDTDSAFQKLFELWGAKYRPDGTDPCTQASRAHLECLAERGSFGQLRLYNHPAILMLSDGAGGSHQVVLTALDDEHARLDLGGPHEVSLGELSHFWLGNFVMLWRPASSPVKSLSAGMRGAEVRWLRQSLQQLAHVESSAPVSDVFDAELTGLVREFQRQHQLSVDGIAGPQTQIALAGAVAGPGVPLLTAADTHGG